MMEQGKAEKGDDAVLAAVDAMKVKEWDMWRDSPLRYLGYANEIGEAVAPLYRRALLPSYLVSICYVMGDVGDKLMKEYSTQLSKVVDLHPSEQKQSIDYRMLAKEGADCFTWQILASVAIPGLTIKGVTKVAAKFINHEKFRPANAIGRRYFPTMIGLVTIPFIIQPIDLFVHELMENTFRHVFK